LGDSITASISLCVIDLFRWFVESGMGEDYEDIKCRAAAFPEMFMSNNL
jgi:hypothetical protein